MSVGTLLLATVVAPAHSTASGQAARTDTQISAEPDTGPDDGRGTEAARAALDRLAPRIAHRFVLELEPPTDEGGSFTIEARNNRIVLAGSDNVAILSAFDYYLENIAHGQISRMGDNIPVRLPAPAEPIRKSTAYQIRDAYNFTVAGYTYPFWDWEEWEREIDLLALSGVNHALVTIGQEAVWYDTWQRFGYSAEEARAWISPPAHQPWQFMSNMHSFAGGMSEGLIEQRAELGRRIVDRMRELGITPVLPGFSGSVPDGFAERNPGARVVPQGEWYGFMRPEWLDTTTELYQDVAAVFYASQRDRFGSVPDQAIDLLHEGGQSGGVDLTEAAQGIVAALEQHDEDYVWVIQAWGGNPRRDVIEGIAPEHVLVQDLTGGRWSGSQAFWGAPWVWGILPNFGGRTGLYGNLPSIASNVPTLLERQGTGSLVGTTIMSEGVDTNPVVWELMTSAIWESEPIDLDQWLNRFVTARYGVADDDAIDAWRTIYAAAYDSGAGHPGGADSLFNAEPSLTATKASQNAPGSLPYRPDELEPALVSLLRAERRLGKVETFRHDLVDVARQVVVNQSRVLLPQIKTAFEGHDIDEFEALTGRWLDMMDLADELLATHEAFMLGPWLAEARRWGADKDEADRLEYDARSLVSIWGSCWSGGPINNDYANRDWAGLLSDYYKPRWQAYFAGLAEQLRTGQAPPVVDYCQRGQDWARETTALPIEPRGDSAAAAQRVAEAVLGTAQVQLEVSPSLATPGVPLRAEIDLTNMRNRPLTGLEASIDLPDGWKAEATEPLPAAARPHEELTAAWTITPGDDVKPSTNLALGQVATQSSEFRGGRFPASNAVDGDPSNFSHTAEDGSREPWWQVDLGKVSDIGEIRVWNRADCCQDRVAGLYLFISDEPFTTTTVEETVADADVRTIVLEEAAGRPTSVSVQGRGRYVRLQTVKTTPLNIAEVEVLDTVYPLTATVRYRSGRDVGEVAHTATVAGAAAHDSLAEAYNSNGLTSDGDPSGGNLDGELRPAEAADIVTGQAAIRVEGRVGWLAFLGSRLASGDGVGTVVYAGGSTEDLALLTRRRSLPS
ncbi:alpha-N-acetylglucosaminidase TIM-barrel domain-containing protein [Jiangella alba]|uniref:alpha-N-acetylglucosaminidase TIM-barrel domain-containing protein n=1 Tax=Jiangella alba TaxID=561176 RepID=UPI0014959077|nr:alpha-N-acetylglucosaminidase TIM-barrel domain-containing protein [Jiangella alba]